MLAFQFFENGGQVRDTGAVGKIVRLDFVEFVQVLQMAADDPTLENAQTFHRLEPRTHPMPRVRARSNPRITAFHQGVNVVRVPHPVVRVVLAFGMIVETDADIEFLDQFLNSVDGIRRFGGDAV